MASIDSQPHTWPLVLRGLIVAAFVLAGVLMIARLVIRYSVDGDSWQQGEWLINYSAGFIRRGFFGHGVYLIDQAGLVPAALTLFVTQVTLVIAFLIAVTVLLLRAPLRFETLLVAVSPAFVFFPLWDFQGGLRKDLLLLTGFAWLVVWSGKAITRAGERALYLAAWIVFPAIAVINHEGLAFFLPAMFVVFWAISRQQTFSPRQVWGTIASAFALASIPLFLAIVYSGSEQQADAICQSLVEAGFRERMCWGAVWSLGWSLERGFEQTVFMASWWYLPLGLLALVPFLLFRYSKPLLIGSVAALVAVVPMFFLGGDWGRWIYLVVSIGSLGVLRLTGSNELSPRVTSPRLSLSRPLATALLLVYALAWHLPHAHASGIEPGLINLLEAFLAN